MIIYNKDWLTNKGIQEKIITAFKQGLLIKEEKEAAINNYPVGFYSPNYFIRIGLGILTCIITLFTLGFFGLLGSSFSENITVLLVITGMVCYIALEFMVRQNNHFCSGVDDVLLYAAVLLVVNGICYGTFSTNRLPESIVALLYFIVTLSVSLRFIDRITTTAAYISFFAFVFYSYLHLGTIAKATMPFVVIILSTLIYFFAIATGKNKKWVHYYSCLSVIKILSLLTFYVGGNYFVIRELSDSMFQLHLKPTDSISLGWFFWIWTLAVPILYVVKGIIKKTRYFIHVGILLFAVSISTIRFYHQVLPVEVAFLLGGCILIAIGYGLIKFLGTPKNNFTALPINDDKNFANIEALIAVTVATNHKISAQHTTEFGGGSSGGAGASGRY